MEGFHSSPWQKQTAFELPHAEGKQSAVNLKSGSFSSASASAHSLPLVIKSAEEQTANSAVRRAFSPAFMAVLVPSGPRTEMVPLMQTIKRQARCDGRHQSEGCATRWHSAVGWSKHNL